MQSSCAVWLGMCVLWCALVGYMCALVGYVCALVGTCISCRQLRSLRCFKMETVCWCVCLEARTPSPSFTPCTSTSSWPWQRLSCLLSAVQPPDFEKPCVSLSDLQGMVFELGAVTVDPQTSSYNPRPLVSYMAALEVPYFYEEQGNLCPSTSHLT